MYFLFLIAYLICCDNSLTNNEKMHVLLIYLMKFVGFE